MNPVAFAISFRRPSRRSPALAYHVCFERFHLVRSQPYRGGHGACPSIKLHGGVRQKFRWKRVLPTICDGELLDRSLSLRIMGARVAPHGCIPSRHHGDRLCSVHPGVLRTARKRKLSCRAHRGYSSAIMASRWFDRLQGRVFGDALHDSCGRQPYCGQTNRPLDSPSSGTASFPFGFFFKRDLTFLDSRLHPALGAVWGERD